MARKTKADIVEQVTQNVRRKIDIAERNIYKADVRLIIDAFIEECRRTVIEGDSVTLKGFMNLSLEERPPRVVSTHFDDKPSRHVVGPRRVIKVAPCNSFRNAVRERYRSETAEEDNR